VVTGKDYPGEPLIRVYDVMAQGSSGGGLEPASGRHLDLPVSELSRLLAVLGADGLQALCLYLEHLEHVPGVDGELTLGVPHFSARWLLTASLETADRTGTAALSKNAATRGHQAVERSGLLHAVANPSTVPGQGARGRTWRAVLNPRLVVIRGGREDLDELPQVLRGRPRKSEESPVSRFTRNRGAGPDSREGGSPGNRVVEPHSRLSRNRDPGTPDKPFDLVRAGLLESGTSDSTSAVGVVQELLSSRSQSGYLAAVLVPALRRDRSAVIARLRPLFNELPVGERSAETVTRLALPSEETRRPDILGALIADTLLGERDTVADLGQLGVSGPPPALSLEQLRERLVVGLLIGWGLRRVASWGAWLYQATRPGWAPKPGPLLDRFIQLVRSLEPLLVDAPPSAEPQPNMPLPVVSAATTQATDRAPEEPELLSEETVHRYFAAAQRKWPMFCRDGSVQAADPVWRSRLVRMYLAAEERQTTLDSTGQVMMR
jgi:hypothetical protein